MIKLLEQFREVHGEKNWRKGLAALLGVSLVTVYNWEQGKHRMTKKHKTRLQDYINEPLL